MPIYNRSNIVDNLFLGNTNIREVYVGDTYIYSIFNVLYRDRNEDTSGYNPGSFIWGLSYDLPNLVDKEDEMEYLSHWYGWYDSIWLEDKINKIYSNVKPHDIRLYAKWKQKLFEFYGEWQYDGGGGDVPTRSTPPNTGDSAYPWSGPATLAMPNCTWYVYYRVQEAGATAPLDGGWHNANTWITSTPGSGWTAIPGETDFKPGDIICYDEREPGDGGHVAFVEGDGSISGSWYTSLSYREGHTAGELSDWILNGAGSSYSYRYWHNDRTSSSEYSGTIQGVLRYDGWSGGSSSQSGRVRWTDNGIDQKSPIEQLPSFYGAPDGSYWTRTAHRTSERGFKYTQDGAGDDWEDFSVTSSSTWDTSWQTG